MIGEEFGPRLRELRRQAGLSQRELAEKIGVNFSYLSKIESGAMPPPSEEVILKLAEALKTDKDELMILAGKIPPDIAQILKNRKALQLLRSERIRRKIGEPVRNEGRVTTMKKSSWYKNLARIAIPVTLVCAVAASLWFAAPQPAKAFDVAITVPASGTLGSTHPFTVTIAINLGELVPIQSIKMEIYNVANPSYKATLNNLPLTKGESKSYTNAETGGGAASITASSPNDNWPYIFGSGYANWQGTGYSFGNTFGYGYANNQAARMTYTGTWTSPSSWPAGSYQARITILASSPTLTESFIKNSSSFTLSAPSVGGIGGGGAGVVTVSPGVFNVSQVTTIQGVFLQEAALRSADNNVQLVISKNTVGKTSTGTSLSVVSILPMDNPPSPPANTNIIGLVYNITPDGATFAPAITVTFKYDPANIPAGVAEANLKLAYFDATLNKWVELTDIVVDTVNKTISGKTSHFSAFTVLAYLPKPASFTVSNLNVSPTTVDSGKVVTITAIISNTGELAGTCQVTLQVNGVTEDTEDINIDGGVSKMVTFTTSKIAAGTYTITVTTPTGSVNGSFSVRAAQVPPKPAEFVLGDLKISPTTVESGNSVTISATVINTGDLSSSYQVVLKIDDATEATRDLTVAGGASQTVTFTAIKPAGTHTVKVIGGDAKELTGSFTVKAPPAEIQPPPPKAGIAWWVWLIVVVAALAVIGLLTYFLWWRRRYSC